MAHLSGIKLLLDGEPERKKHWLQIRISMAGDEDMQDQGRDVILKRQSNVKFVHRIIVKKTEVRRRCILTKHRHQQRHVNVKTIKESDQ